MIYRFDSYVLDAERRELRRGREVCLLEPQVFDLLEYLLRNRQRVVSRDELMKSVWRGRVVSEAALDTRLSAARHAINDRGTAQRLIRTLRTKGFRFVGAVREEGSASKAAHRRPIARKGRTTVPSWRTIPPSRCFRSQI